MGKPKKQRTEDLRQAIIQRAVAEESQNSIEQYNFKRLVAQGFIVKRRIGMVKHLELKI